MQANREKVLQAEADVAAGGAKEGATVFHELLLGSLPDEEKTTLRLQHESQVILGAGTETTAWTLSVVTAYLLLQPDILKKLRAQLDPVNSDSSNVPSLQTLEKVPYMHALLLEGLRLTYGVASRLARAAPDEELYLRNESGELEYVIPRGTPIGMTSVLVHQNAKIFPDPEAFKPERWLDDDGKVRTDLQRYLLSFSKGSRQCLGMK
jgi:cytochrome P450